MNRIIDDYITNATGMPAMRPKHRAPDGRPRLIRFIGVNIAFCLVSLVFSGHSFSGQARGEEPADSRPPEAKKKLSKDPPGMRRLLPDADLWLDTKKKRVVLDGTICLREGLLEMFACLKGTKEHESIVSCDVKAYAVHAALLAAGAAAGTPVQFQPEYRPPTGTPVEITVIWTDAEGKVHRERAQNWIKDLKTRKEMEQSWVFAGSGFWEDETTGEKHYLAESGDFICVANFPSAMLDIPAESSQGNEALMFQAYSERIPPLGTKVRLVLTPQAVKKPAPVTEP